MLKIAQLAAIALLTLALAGCGEDVKDTTASSAQRVAEGSTAAESEAPADETPAPVETPTEDPTAPGEVCDPQSGDDFPCLVKYPDIAVGNMTAAPRSREPLASLTTAERITLAHQACEVLAAGGTQETDILVGTVPESSAESPTLNNFSVFSAGAAAYCPDHAEQWVQDALAAASAG